MPKSTKNLLNTPLEITEADADDVIYRVSDLNGAARELLETNLGTVWVEGEVSNLTRAASGHCYFSLKDDKAFVRCALFKGRQKVQTQIEHGMQVLVRARVSLYEPRGDYQLIIEHLEEAGQGALQRAFLALKEKLAAKGWFDAKHKKPFPAFPTCIGVITSPTGAAVRDILHVLKRRFPAVPVIIYPTLVQGNEAAPQIVRALALAEKHRACDVLIVARGGGSLEDLWPFNEEIVAAAIFKHPIPIITGIGHEIDFTIADFVADERAPTPSAAAERISPDGPALHALAVNLQVRCLHIMRKILQLKAHLLQTTQQRLRHPMHLLQSHQQKLDELEHRLTQGWHALLKNRQYKFQQLIRTLHALSPLATLSRGYAIVKNAKGEIVQTTKSVQPNDILHTQLHEGSITSIVFSLTPDANAHK